MLGCRESVIGSLAALFLETDLPVDEGEEAAAALPRGERRHTYRTTAAMMRQRLQLDGFTARRSRDELDEAVQAWLREGNRRDISIFDDVLSELPVYDGPMILEELRTYLAGSNPFDAYTEHEPLRRLDVRAFLRLAVDVVPDDIKVAYCLDDLIGLDDYRAGVKFTDRARTERERELARNGSMVVLTEGSKDARALEAGMRITHPHLVGLLRFMDFDNSNAEGGAPALAKAVKAFAAARIPTRVVAIADNDTSAYDHLDVVKRMALPDHYRILHYPEIPLLQAYPTLGPQDPQPVVMNVNGRAGALEMYLGRTLLIDGDELIPIRWVSYVPSQDGYQGALADHHKNRIFKQFMEIAIKASESDRAAHDWSGIHAIIEAVVSAFDVPSEHG